MRVFYRCPVIELGPEDRPAGMDSARGPSIVPVINEYAKYHRDIEGHPGVTWAAVLEIGDYMGVRVDIHHEPDATWLLEKLDRVAERV